MEQSPYPYIFDKKSTILNKCDGKNCKIIETKLPSKTVLNQDIGFQQSKLFETEKPMATATLETSASKPETKEPIKPENNNAEAKSKTKTNSETDSDTEKTEENTKAEAEQSGASEETSNTEQDSDKQEGSDKQAEEEFVE